MSLTRNVTLIVLFWQCLPSSTRPSYTLNCQLVMIGALEIDIKIEYTFCLNYANKKKKLGYLVLVVWSTDIYLIKNIDVRVMFYFIYINIVNFYKDAVPTAQ